MFKILVCGSRETKDKEFVFSKLDYLTSKKSLNEIEIVQGGQKSFDKPLEIYYGADYFAKLWTETRNIKMTRYKDSGKWLETLKAKSDLPCFDFGAIQKEMEEQFPFLKKENYVISLRSADLILFNERLVLNNI